MDSGAVDTRKHTLARWLSACAFGLVAFTPAVMVFSRESPPLLVALVCAFLGASIVAGGRSLELRGSLTGTLTSPGALLLGLGLLLMAVSLSWSLAPGRGAAYLLETAGSAVGLALAASAVSNRLVPLPTRRQLAIAILVGFAVAAAVIASQGLFGLSIRRMMGLTRRLSRLNRAALEIALLLPLAVALLWRARAFALAALAGIAGAVGVLASQSESAKLVLGLSLLLAPAAVLAPRLTHQVTGFLVLAAVLVTPFAAGYVNELIPAAVHKAIGYDVITLRAEIWREYANLYWQKPLLGFGLESSYAISASPYAAGLPEASRRLLNQTHPHNAPLQIWFEFGALGGLTLAALLGLAWRAIGRLSAELLAPATLTSVGAIAVAFVSHGAWQAWWYCLLVLVAVAYMAAANDRGPGTG